jgi:hypothetical protein
MCDSPMQEVGSQCIDEHQHQQPQPSVQHERRALVEVHLQQISGWARAVNVVVEGLRIMTAALLLVLIHERHFIAYLQMLL